MKKLMIIFAFLAQIIRLTAMQPYSDFARDCHEISHQSPFENFEYPHGFVVRLNGNAFAYNQGNTTLHHLAKQGDATGVDTLLKAGALMEPNQNGETPLHLAIKNNQFEVIEKIIVYKPSTIDATAISLAETYNTLHGLAQYGMVDAFEKLIKAGVPITHNPNGDTPLHVAAKYGQCKLLKKIYPIQPLDLIDQAQANDNGLTALQLAQAYGQQETVEYLKKRIAHLQKIALQRLDTSDLKRILRSPESQTSPTSPKSPSSPKSVSIDEALNITYEHEEEQNEE